MLWRPKLSYLGIPQRSTMPWMNFAHRKKKTVRRCSGKRHVSDNMAKLDATSRRPRLRTPQMFRKGPGTQIYSMQAHSCLTCLFGEPCVHLLWALRTRGLSHADRRGLSPQPATPHRNARSKGSPRTRQASRSGQLWASCSPDIRRGLMMCVHETDQLKSCTQYTKAKITA